ncbi:MAG: sodium:solute symporter family transporter [Planctomycetota bacterium]
MDATQWCIVLAINLAIILYGVWKSKETASSVQWFLAAKGLPWWMVGLSMFATAVDSGDYVAAAGQAYRDGMPYISAWWLGITVGWLVVAYVVFPPIYRTGMFTNTEYLEYRYGPTARLISVFIQIQYRTNVLANVAFSLYLTFNVLTGWGPHTWWVVVAIALGAALYTAMGGVKSVAITDSMQSVVMLVASLVLWFSVWQAVGSWKGLEQRLSTQAPQLADKMLRVGGYDQPGVPPVLVVAGWIMVLTGYCVVNHSQAMRMLAARSQWDMKMAAVVAAAVTALAMWFNVTLGIMGRALVPELEMADEIFPQLFTRYLSPWLLGIVIAGLLAGGISTFDSIGSSLAAVFTRDFYARFLVRNRDDRHYLLVSRISTFLLIGIAFVYIPFIHVGMVELYLQLVGVAVLPLLTVYLMGVLTRVHRSSATVGLIAGIICGLSRLTTASVAGLPVWWTNKWWGLLWSIATTGLAMILTSMMRGWATRDEIAGLTVSSARQQRTLHAAAIAGTWLERSQQQVPVSMEATQRKASWYQNPVMWSILVLTVVGIFNLVVFW